MFNRRANVVVPGHENDVGDIDVEVGDDDVEVGDDDIEVGDDDVEVGDDDIEIGDDDVEIGDDDVEVRDDDVEVRDDDIEVGDDVVEVRDDDVEVRAHTCLMRNIGRVLLLLGISAVMLLLHCRTTNEPQPQVTFDMLSPQEQARIRPFLKADAHGNVDPDWQRIVQRTCKVNPIANCICCDPKTARACNPTNWQCCGSVVFQPADGSSCSFPNPCACPVPPTADKAATAAARSSTRR